MKLHNDYLKELPSDLYERTPKAVWAALAVSLALRLNEDQFEAVPVALCAEWSSLHQAGVVPQKPPSPERVFGFSTKGDQK